MGTLLANIWFMPIVTAAPLKTVVFQHVGFILKPITKQNSYH